jgi:hypothetical protein
MKDATNPVYRAYSVVNREDQDDFWIPVGVAFSHRDGAGFNVLLQALPINGKIVLRPAKEKTKSSRDD